jgi:hypothetical protein
VRLSNFGDWAVPFRRPEDIKQFLEAYRLAGMPE